MDTPDISGVSEGIKESIKANIEEKLQEEELLPTCNVGISISDSQDLDILGFTNLHIQDAMVIFRLPLPIRKLTLGCTTLCDW